MTLQELYRYPLLTSYNSKHGVASVCLPGQLVGLELEIEGFNSEIEARFGGFTFTEDGSLRHTATGRGVEAISKPVAACFVPGLLNAFFTKFNITEANYSERCSTHVHFNVRPLQVEQLATICLIYQTVERLLFRYVGHDRGSSIFCVPWHQSNMSYQIVNTLVKGNPDNVFRRWQKYSALNLIPVTSLGTIEFRHLHGTCDVKLISEWIELICKIFHYAQRVPFEQAQQSIIGMNTVSNYHQWLTEVFGELAGVLQSPNFDLDLVTGVIDSKLMLTAGPVQDSGFSRGLEEMLAAMAPPPAHPPVLRPRDNRILFDDLQTTTTQATWPPLVRRPMTIIAANPRIGPMRNLDLPEEESW